MFKFLYSFVLVSIVFTNAYTQTGWQRITPPYQYDFSPSGLNRSLFLTADSGIVASWKTTNGAKSWTPLLLPESYDNKTPGVETSLVWNCVFPFNFSKYFVIGSFSFV